MIRRCVLLRKLLIAGVLVGIAVVVIRTVGPDVKRYIKISRM